VGVLTNGDDVNVWWRKRPGQLDRCRAFTYYPWPNRGSRRLSILDRHLAFCPRGHLLFIRLTHTRISKRSHDEPFLEDYVLPPEV